MGKPAERAFFDPLESVAFMSEAGAAPREGGSTEVPDEDFFGGTATSVRACKGRAIAGGKGIFLREGGIANRRRCCFKLKRSGPSRYVPRTPGCGGAADQGLQKSRGSLFLRLSSIPGATCQHLVAARADRQMSQTLGAYTEMHAGMGCSEVDSLRARREGARKTQRSFRGLSYYGTFRLSSSIQFSTTVVAGSLGRSVGVTSRNSDPFGVTS
jgi:hypothetical protein